MPRWGLVVEQNLGFGRQGRMWSVGVIDHVEGSREEALAALRVRAERFEPVHPSNPKSRRLYQEADGFLLVVEGVWQPWHCRFTVAEQLYDSAAPERLEEEPPAAEPDPTGPTQAVPRPREPEPDPGPPPAWDAEVPEVPSWLGRDDLP
ncbi:MULTISPECIES: hypothetical protein [Streptomyces]|uniref:Uncharacterized protein n=1 Tax=Streptomyces glycanivorans TaxID=3033808 RepID=A0ABY9JR19_9ACTN|nr:MULTISPECIES: hypothetical protein [unclassified Streptomyces]WSQ81802.1 hypothetical protein OG725_33940 [Streptomyces sp. NBC_01213]TXS15889.1 hypothetical protein EAO68_16220 [Streptomyces sp. wa22]WLQ68442.1 hypothetical protein P8A20_34940 [Streptomyces sp. Alt3]WSQ89128.1 hypothetical protein OG722_34340 [Streptomyces sp. NBC_01212]WSR04866.1 hypothetical protein OG265_02160 [Streptomyces sp. NBC_01208]